MIEMYKIIKGKYNKGVITLVKTAEKSEVRHSTKTNTKKIVQLRANTELRRNFFKSGKGFLKALLIIANIEFALFTFSLRCLSNFSPLSIVTPISFSSCVHSIFFPSINH
jgi:uncharacterized ferritin-like protein (DUF455 family)